MKPEELRSWLFERKNVGMRPGLTRVRSMLQKLGNPEREFDSILVAGTNGKGSVTASLDSCLMAGGYSSARFTSPHLQRVTERFVINGQEASFDHLAQVLAELRDEADRLRASFFEITTAAAFRLFADAKVDFGVIEVGLGGRLDATNVVEPVLSVITEIGLDHTGTLGETLAEIAKEKAGILRSGVPAVTSARGQALREIKCSAARLVTPLLTLDEASISHQNLGWSGLKIGIEGWGKTISVQSPAVGTHQVRNQALAIAAGWSINLPNESLKRGIKNSVWQGRLERFLYRGREVVLDGAHNPAAARIVSRELTKLLPAGYTLLLGITKGKDALGVLKPLCKNANHLVLTEAVRGPKGMPVSELKALCPESDSVIDPVQALGAAIEQTPTGGALVIAGSLYLVGILREIVMTDTVKSKNRV